MTKIIVLNKEETEFTMVPNERAHRLISIYAQAVMIFLDTYMVVSLAIERLCGTNKVQRLKHLVYELHVSIKNLFESKVVTFLHSCLEDNIYSCIHRFSELNLIKIMTYANKNGEKSEFIVVP